MRPKPSEKTPESSRFINQSDTIAVLAEAHEYLVGLNYDYQQYDLDSNPSTDSSPYEGAVLFGIDTRPTDRASALLHATAEGLENSSRLEFVNDAIIHRRVILSQTALGEALKEPYPLFMESKMKENQMVWTQPLLVNKKPVAAIQLAYTINTEDDWRLPENDPLEKIWKKHEARFLKVAHNLSLLSLKTGSLSKSLEIEPPINPNAFVISWDVINSTPDVLSRRYATHETYLETWKAKRAEITQKYNVTVLDRGDGEHIIVPYRTDKFNEDRLKKFGERTINPLINELIQAHNAIAADFQSAISRKISIGVGVGNLEEDQDGNLTGQAITEIESLRNHRASQSIFYTPEAKRLLN